MRQIQKKAFMVNASISISASADKTESVESVKNILYLWEK